MRIDILVSVLSKEVDNLETIIEEHNLKNEIAKLLVEKGYEKFIVAGSDMISDDVKRKATLD